MAKEQPLPAKAAKAQALDDLIMGTNSSSIVSKRSVERFYYPDETHFFRYFVPKFQRRAPLINRGYWLRLRAIDVIVRQFLNSPCSSSKKVVINLGCGSDVLPWQCHHRYESACKDTVFVDIDYPDLMRKKRAIVLGTPQLRDLLGDHPYISDRDTDQLLLKSDKYCQLACDLRQLDSVRQCLESFLTLSDCSVLFVAEVSVTYMDTVSADALIEWASSIGKAEFCLLEQILPNGPDHPFAKTMLNHFSKLNTPLKSVHQYPSLDSQQRRFQQRGWHTVDIWDLWEAWNNETFLSSAERIALDDIEPFDEWEEFVLFARHYCVVHATAYPKESQHPTKDYSTDPGQQIDISIQALGSLGAPKRRFGLPMTAKNPEGQQYIVQTLGLGNSSRLGSCDVYTLGDANIPFTMSPVGPSARLCHTLTDLGAFGFLLVGGRASPSKALSDCWLFKKDTNSWENTFDLPIPLFRHTTIRLPGSSLALVIGGRAGPRGVSSEHLVFHPIRGWLKCAVSRDRPRSLFGAVVLASPVLSEKPGLYHGVLAGGMTNDGTINTQAFRWNVDATASQPSIHFEALNNSPRSLALFGAQSLDVGRFTAVCGGIGQEASCQGQDIVFVSTLDAVQIASASPSHGQTADWPFMIGSSTVSVGSSLIVFGGGATCFSMGTFWDARAYAISVPDIFSGIVSDYRATDESIHVSYLNSPKLAQQTTDTSDQPRTPTECPVTTVPRIQVNSKNDFEEALRNRTPVIIEGLDSGTCVERWTPEYMTERLGGPKEVVVHESLADTDKMDFNSKNFRYVTQSFETFMEKASSGQRVYMRALSEEKPSDAPADFSEDFPSLADDFQVPEQLSYVKEQLFSSVLRISGRVNMWLHYDVMANVYTQIRGSKRMILFPPTDVRHLAFAPGASSSSLDVFSALERHQLGPTHPHEAVLNPGDVLLLPAMWFHTATPTTDMSVAINIFFRDLESGYSTGRDVYGNRDLAAYEKGRQDVARMAKSFERLPQEIRRFYLARLADELVQEQF